MNQKKSPQYQSSRDSFPALYMPAMPPMAWINGRSKKRTR